MLYAVALAVFAALIVGVIPALKATGAQLQGRMRDAASGTSAMKFGGLWTAIIVTQAAITVIFLATVVSFGWTQLRKQWGSDVTYARDRLLTAPGGHQLGSAIHVAVRLPGRIEERRLVRDADVLREPGDDRVPERCGCGLPGLVEIHRRRLPLGPSECRRAPPV